MWIHQQSLRIGLRQAQSRFLIRSKKFKKYIFNRFSRCQQEYWISRQCFHSQSTLRQKIKVFLNRLPLSLGHNNIWKVVPFCCPQTKDQWCDRNFGLLVVLKRRLLNWEVVKMSVCTESQAQSGKIQPRKVKTQKSRG